MTILQLDEHVNLGGSQTGAGGAEVDGDDCDYEKIACKCDKNANYIITPFIKAIRSAIILVDTLVIYVLNSSKMLERLQLSGVDVEERAIIEMKKIATVWKKADKKE